MVGKTKGRASSLWDTMVEQYNEWRKDSPHRPLVSRNDDDVKSLELVFKLNRRESSGLDTNIISHFKGEDEKS